jgi:hypothetical protein
VSWICPQCGIPNFSSTLFDTSSFEVSNIYDPLNIDSPGPPQATSSPVNQRKRNQTANDKKKKPFRVLIINFQSIGNKEEDMSRILESTKPDIVFGTETWMNEKSNPYEYFPKDDFTVSTVLMHYRQNIDVLGWVYYLYWQNILFLKNFKLLFHLTYIHK